MRIWFVSTRIAGNDGVSLEAARWHHILRNMGHKVTFVAGELDRRGILIPELHFTSPKIMGLYDKVVYGKNRFGSIEKDLFDISGTIEGKLREVMNGKKPDLMVVANVFSLPMNFPFAVALSRVIEEFKIPVVARHHDFWWERKRFLRSTMFPFFKRWFPPKSTYVKHVVINSDSQSQLLKRTGINSSVISDCFNFEYKRSKLDKYSASFRKDFGLSRDDVVFLQATRIVPRKRIELAIKLVEKINDPRAVLLIAGHSGDEGGEYELELRALVSNSKARVLFIGDYIGSVRRIKSIIKGFDKRPKRRKVYTLWDAFVNSDFMTYPTLLEGFGNQFIESVFFKKPIILTPYPVYKKDIKPLGFESIEMDEQISERVIKKVKFYMDNKKAYGELVEKNFELGKKYFSFEATEEKIKGLLN